MNETTAVFLGIIIGVFLVLFCCAILFVYTKITKRIDSFKETERKAYTKIRDRAEERVELIKKAEAKNAESELKVILARQNEIQRRLEELYALKGDEWVASIVAGATGDDK